MKLKTAIKIENAEMGYRKQAILTNVNMELAAGKINCVFGRNGKGKTTFLKSVAGLLPLLGGKVKIDDSDLQQLGDKERALKLAVVLTYSPVIGNMNLEDYVKFGRYPYTNWLGITNDSDQLATEKAIELCGLNEIRNKSMTELSDGERQKVQIARAIAQETEILLLDEVASHLDLVNRAEIFRLLRNISREGGKTVLFSSHDIQFSIQLAETFIVVDQGQVTVWEEAEFRAKQVYKTVLESKFVQIDLEKNSLNYLNT